MNPVKLGTIVKTYKGKKADLVGDIKQGNLCRYIQIDDLRNNTNLKYTNSKGIHVSPKDVIIAWDGANAGTVGYGLTGIIGSTLAKLELQIDYVLPEYLGRFLKSKSTFLRSKSTGATIPHISGQVLSNLQVPVPSIDEQNRIIYHLDQADSLRHKRTEAIKLLDQYLKSAFVEMFGDPLTNPHGWQITTLEKITKKITDGTHQSPKFVDEGIPFIFISNIIDNKIHLNTKKFISETTYKELTKSTKIEEGDILYTTVGSYGNPAIVRNSEKFCFQRHIAHIKPDTQKTDVYFLYAMLKSPFIKRQADEKARGVAQKTLNLHELKNFKVYLPPLEIQNKFSAIVQETELLKQKMLKQSEELELQFQSLMQKSFSL